MLWALMFLRDNPFLHYILLFAGNVNLDYPDQIKLRREIYFLFILHISLYMYICYGNFVHLSKSDPVYYIFS